jgi:hypothetical protein
MTMSDPLDKNELERLKASELARYVPPHTNEEVQELYWKALAKEPWWKGLWYKTRSRAATGAKGRTSSM